MLAKKKNNDLNFTAQRVRTLNLWLISQHLSILLAAHQPRSAINPKLQRLRYINEVNPLPQMVHGVSAGKGASRCRPTDQESHRTAPRPCTPTLCSTPGESCSTSCSTTRCLKKYKEKIITAKSQQGECAPSIRPYRSSENTSSRVPQPWQLH